MDIVIAYVPVLHRGYVDFFNRFPWHRICVLGEDFIEEFPRLLRDTRALSPDMIARSVSAIDGRRTAEVLTRRHLSFFRSRMLGEGGWGEIVLPDEDVMEEFAFKYLGGLPFRYEQTFLRWDMKAVSGANKKPERCVSSNSRKHRELMKRLGYIAERSPDWWRQVGMAIVKNGVPVVYARNTHPSSDYATYIDGDPRTNFDAGDAGEITMSSHAEANGIAWAARSGVSLDGASVFVTTFPCPACARLIVGAGIKEVFFSEGYSLLDAETFLKREGVSLVLVE